MGADGGLCWIQLRRPGDRELAYTLIEPLGLVGGDYRDEDWAYLKAHPEIGETSLISRYGSFLDNQGIHELRGILSSGSDDGRTFEDVALDLATRPEWQMYDLTPVEGAVLRTCAWSVWVDYTERRNATYREEGRATQIGEGLTQLGALRSLRVSDWVREIRSLLVNWEHPEMAETWT
jgi:hypothetical protein